MADLQTVRHSAAHIMAEAVQQIFPEAKMGIGPAIEEGFYYDFDLPRALTPEDFADIEARMGKIIRADLPFKREELSSEEAIRLFEQSDQPYKVELIRDLDTDKVSVYRQGGFVDLCRGPHVEKTGEITAYKILTVAGAYWRGDEHRPMLQRLYATAFPTKEELEQHLYRLAEAQRRDHRKLGRELDLFSLSDELGPGLVLWHPRGARVRRVVEDFWRDQHYRKGYELLYSPHIGRLDLWKTSGHWNSYRENMYSPMEIDEQEYMLKPMNCPYAILIYKNKMHSYRDLPLRWAELGTVYRYERSGALHGMMRVRGFTQDDAHIFCRPDQLAAEVGGVLEFALFMLKSFGFRDFEIDLSVRGTDNPDKYLGSDEVWDRAETALVSALESHDLVYHRAEGEAVFYGPKIDIKLIDALGRSWQGPTIQVDFNLPEKFDLNYVGDDGQEHRVAMVHRTVLGSMERFMGVLIEHYAGAFPVWLAPVQATVLPIADRHQEYANQVRDQLLEAGLRADVDDRREKVNYKIREAQMNKVPYMLIVGDKEVADGTVAVRLRSGENQGPRPLSEVVDTIAEAAASRS
ncbi:MAG: threonine--tRNA ligase [Chloroflexota bacterium]